MDLEEPPCLLKVSQLVCAPDSGILSAFKRLSQLAEFERKAHSTSQLFFVTAIFRPLGIMQTPQRPFCMWNGQQRKSVPLRDKRLGVPFVLCLSEQPPHTDTGAINTRNNDYLS